MTSLQTARDAIKTRLDAAGIVGLEVVSGWPNNVQVPPSGGVLVVVSPTGVEYGQTFGPDSSMVSVEIHVFASMAGGFVNAETNIEPYLSNTGASSLLQALRGDPYLSSTVAYAKPPSGMREYGVKEVGKQTLLGAIVDLEVFVT